MNATQHASDDHIERYTLGTLTQAELSGLEDHLLVCDSCRDRLDTTADYVTAMREALQQDAQPAEAQGPRFAWLTWPRRPAVQMALACLILVAVLAIFSGRRGGPAPVASLQLTATRGEMPSVKPARELDLTLAGAPSDGGPFRVEIVNAQGQSVWSGLADSEGDAVLVKVVARLQPAQYFVRLYSADGPMLHEYGFSVGN